LWPERVERRPSRVYPIEMIEGMLEEAAAQAEELLGTIAPDAVCVAQEWDARVDCILRLPDGSVVGEMVAAGDLTERRVRDAGERLRQRAEGRDVPLVNELRPSVRIDPRRDE
jgi:hypothetical protein